MTSKATLSATAVKSESQGNLRERRASLFAKLQEPGTQRTSGRTWQMMSTGPWREPTRSRGATEAKTNS